MYFYTRIDIPGGTIWLPRYEPVDPLDTGGFTSQTVPIAGGGVFDSSGSDRLPRRMRRIARKGRLIESSAAALEAAYLTIATGSGTRGTLWRQNETGTRAEWATARVMSDAGERTPQGVYRYRGYWALDVTLNFEVQSQVWHGTQHGIARAPLDTSTGLDTTIPLDDVADAFTLDVSPKTIALVNDGNIPVEDLSLSLLVVGSTLTLFGYQCGRAMWAVTCSVPVGNVLHVDNGDGSVANETTLTGAVAAGVATLPVTNAVGTGYTAGGRVRLPLTDGTVYEGEIASIGGTTSVVLTAGLPVGAANGAIVGAAAYSGFQRDSAQHSLDTWTKLLPGSNSVVITRTGGASSVLVASWFDAFA